MELLKDILKKDWQKALEQDEASLKTLKEAIAKLEAGEEVKNLRLPEAREEEKALEEVIKNKKHFISKLGSEKSMGNPRKIFEHALLIEKVASRYCQAMEFPTEKALNKYLKDHPDADKSKHTVKKTEESSGGKRESKHRTVKEMTEGMPIENMSKDKALKHPAVMKLKNKLLSDFASGKLYPSAFRRSVNILEEAKSKATKERKFDEAAQASHAMMAYVDAMADAKIPRT